MQYMFNTLQNTIQNNKYHTTQCNRKYNTMHTIQYTHYSDTIAWHMIDAIRYSTETTTQETHTSHTIEN